QHYIKQNKHLLFSQRLPISRKQRAPKIEEKGFSRVLRRTTMQGFRTFKAAASNAFREYPRVSKLLVVVTVGGGGWLAISDASPFRRITGSDEGSAGPKKKLVVLGTGWGGTTFLKNLKTSAYDVQIVSPHNYFTFTPLLPSVTNGTVEARSIVEPIRNIVRGKPYNVDFEEAECYKIDPVNKKVYCRSSKAQNVGGGEKEFELDYDVLVIAMGARVNTFNTPGVEEHAHFLKEVDDAQKLRRSIIDCYERASLHTASEEDKKRIMHFVVVGGGPTGVEYAAELHDFASQDLARLYPSLKDYLKITLLEAGNHILPMFHKKVTEFANQKFQKDEIEVKTGSMVVKVSDKDISAKDRTTGQVESIPYGVVLWSTGIATRPVINEFMQRIGQAGKRVMATDEWLKVQGCDDVYALGDCASIAQQKVSEDVPAIFNTVDKNKAGSLDPADFKEFINDIYERYPQVKKYMEKNKLKNFEALLKNANQELDKKTIDIEALKKALSEADSQVSFLPPTAQVAAQQGKYLADCFNRAKLCEKKPEGPARFQDNGRYALHPFRYMIFLLYGLRFFHHNRVTV
ncbi:External alternative NAD(P)H-ubiquinone oxidoreductase B4, mitochondrial, partial [Linum grandiflorum]